jgi:PAS domain S-box-containing protein
VVSIAAPIRDAQQQVIGTLVGVTVLSKESFLDTIFGHKYGKTGGYQLVDPVHRRFVAATDKRFVLAPLPEAGREALYDRFNNGFEGTGFTIDARGVENLTSAKRVAIANWYIVALLPTEEAFAPIRRLEQHTIQAATVLTLLAGVLTWWLLRRQFAPLLSAAATLASLRDAKEFPKALEVTRHDEIGQLLWGFNRLLEVLRDREKSLSESEERLHTLVSWAPVAMAVHAQGKLLFVNPAAVQLLGANSPSELVGRPIVDFFHPDYHSIAITRAKASGVVGAESPAVEERLLKLDGTAFDAQVQAIGILYNGAPASQVAMYDITERKAAEKKLRQLSRITEQAQIAIVITNLDGVIEYVNPKFSEVTGFSADQVLGKNPRILQSGQTPAATYEQLWETLRIGNVWRGEFRNRKKNGDIFIEQAVIAPILDNDGIPTYYVALKEDITVRKHNQQRLERLLQEQRMMLENDLIGIVRIADETVLWANPAMESMLGYRHGELVGVPARRHFLGDADYTSMFTAADPVLVSGEVFRHLMQYQRKDGQRIWVDVSGALLHAGSKESIWTCLDVTQRVHAEADLHASLKEKTALLNEVHHRVKNNLQVITSLLRLEDGRAQDANTRGVLLEMQGRIRSMALVHETLYRSGTLSSIDLHLYLQQVATGAFRAQVHSGNEVRLALDLAATKTSMDQATPCGLLVNELISNSLKHAFNGQTSGEVRVCLQPGQPTRALWCLSVSDTGVGLPPDFEQRRKGSLGLQLVSDLVRQLGGTLEIGAGPGAMFTVTFAIDQPKPPVTPASIS